MANGVNDTLGTADFGGGNYSTAQYARIAQLHKEFAQSRHFVNYDFK